MIFNAASVVAGFLALFRIALALAVVARSVAALRARARARSAAERDEAEVVALRPALPAMALFALAVVSWPLLVEVLASYVPMWASVMCIDGVTRVGEGTVGPARHLPRMLDALFVAKPALLLVGGAWLVSHLVQRRAPGRPGPLGPALLLAVGALAMADGVLEMAYLVIPKREETLSAGCCTISAIMTIETERSWLEALVSEPAPRIVIAGLALSVALLVGLLVPAARRGAGGAGVGTGLVALLLVAAAAVALTAQHVFVAVASPYFTGVSTHRCGWCVVEQSPAGGAAMGALVAALGLVLLLALARGLERRAGVAPSVSRLLASGALALIAAAGLLLASAAL